MKRLRVAIGVLAAAMLVAAGPNGEGHPKGPRAGQEGKRGGRRMPGGKVPKPRDAKPGGGGEGEGQRPRAARGNMFLRQNNTRAAAASFEKQLEDNPESAALNVGYAKALARIGRCDEALAHFWPYVGTLPFGADAALAAATCSSREGLLEDAIYFDHMAVDLDPESARALTNLALDCSTAGDEVGLAEALDDLLLLRPEKDASHYARAVLALRAGDLDTFDRVVEAWERQEGPSLDLRRLQAQSWLDMDDPVHALASLGNVKRIRNGQQVRHLRAEAYRREGYIDEAALYLEDRPQSVLEGQDADAIRIRVSADKGDFAAAHAVLDGYKDKNDADLVASAWYLAWREHREADMTELAERYERVQTNPLRKLEHLVPWTEKPS